MSISKLLLAAVAAAVPALLCVSTAACAEGDSSSQPILRPAKERGNPVASDNLVSGAMTKQKGLSLCLDSWDAQTHMSRREWRGACERSVKDYPDAFN
jgi:hypothetical protein